MSYPGKRRTLRSEARRDPELERSLGRLGDRVRALRESRGLTQEQAAEAASISITSWKEIEAGRTNVTYATELGIARALGVTISKLFEGV